MHQVVHATVHLGAELMTLVLEVIAIQLDLLYALPNRVHSTADNGSGTRSPTSLGRDSMGRGGGLLMVTLSLKRVELEVHFLVLLGVRL